MGTIIISGALLLAVGLAVRSIIKDRKKGKSCACGCSNCKGCH